MLRNSGEFDLATLQRTFVLRANDSLVSQLGPGLIAAARAAAPGVRLRFVAEGEEDVQPLRDGRIDLDLGMIDLPDSRDRRRTAARRAAAPRDLPPRPHRSAVRRRARRARAEPRRRGRRPDADGRVEHVLASDLVCLTTSGFAARVTDGRPLPVPADLPLRPMAQAWHPRFAKDPGHRWLRARVRDAAPTG